MNRPSLSMAFLINPVSGGGIGRQVYAQLPEIMDSFGFERRQWKAELTEKERMAEQTDLLLDSARKVIAVGGDGTIGFLLDRLRAKPRPETEVGLIPLGTGNDLGRSLGVYRIYSQKGLLACVKRLIKAQSTLFDLWDINRTLTLASYFSFGMDAAVLKDFDCARSGGRIPKGAVFNLLYYVKAFCVHSRRRIREPVELRTLGPGAGQYMSLRGAYCCLIANVNSYAAGCRPFRRNAFNDGLLSILVFDALWKYLVLVGLGRILPVTARLAGRRLKVLTASGVEINNLAGIPAQLDGENVTAFCAGHPDLVIRPAGQVRLLDLRRVYFSLF